MKTSFLTAVAIVPGALIAAILLPNHPQLVQISLVCLLVQALAALWVFYRLTHWSWK